MNIYKNKTQKEKVISYLCQNLTSLLKSSVLIRWRKRHGVSEELLCDCPAVCLLPQRHSYSKYWQPSTQSAGSFVSVDHLPTLKCHHIRSIYHSSLLSAYLSIKQLGWFYPGPLKLTNYHVISHLFSQYLVKRAKINLLHWTISWPGPVTGAVEWRLLISFKRCWSDLWQSQTSWFPFLC